MPSLSAARLFKGFLHKEIEGPHSTIPEDEFFDAVETGLDKIEEDRQLRVRLKFQSQQSQISTTSSVLINQETDDSNQQLEDFGTGAQARSHKYIRLPANLQAHLAGQSTRCSVLVSHAKNHRQFRRGRT